MLKGSLRRTCWHTIASVFHFSDFTIGLFHVLDFVLQIGSVRSLTAWFWVFWVGSYSLRPVFTLGFSGSDTGKVLRTRHFGVEFFENCSHDCVFEFSSDDSGFYDKWYKAQTQWVYLACHGSNVDLGYCNAVRDKFVEKNEIVSIATCFVGVFSLPCFFLG